MNAFDSKNNYGFNAEEDYDFKVPPPTITEGVVLIIFGLLCIGLICLGVWKFIELIGGLS